MPDEDSSTDGPTTDDAPTAGDRPVADDAPTVGGKSPADDAAAFSASISSDGVAFDDSDATLLRTVEEFGSVSGAAAELGRSRARALTRLETLEEAFGDLVYRQRGGPDGGGSRLTGAARNLLGRFDRLRAALAGTAGATESVLHGTVRERQGELAVVETAAGRVRALAVDDPVPGTAVDVSVRSDAVTLHAPGESPPPDATSARNRLDGTAVAVTRGDAVVEVGVAVGGDEPLTALVTAESAARLDLTEGCSVVASLKATATRAVPSAE